MKVTRYPVGKAKNPVNTTEEAMKISKQYGHKGNEMREHKYKAWCKDRGMSSPFNPFDDLFVYFKGTFNTYPNGKGRIHTTANDERLKWLEYTGLKDKHGKEIYEGDIIKTNAYPFMSDGKHNYSAVVEYIDDPEYLAWYYDIFSVSDRVAGRAVGGMLADLYGQEIEIIGNRYENPELLEED